MDFARHKHRIAGWLRSKRVADQEAKEINEAVQEEFAALLQDTGRPGPAMKAALGMIAKLDKMDNVRRQDVLALFDDARLVMEPIWTGGQLDWVQSAMEPASSEAA